MKTILFKTIIIAFFVEQPLVVPMKMRTDSVRDLPMRNRIPRSRRADWIIPN